VPGTTENRPGQRFTRGFHHYTAPQAVSVRQTRREKVGRPNARACDSQRRELAAASGVPPAIRKQLFRTVLYFSISPQVPAAYRRNCGAERRVTEF